jgi:hypothetical protein
MVSSSLGSPPGIQGCDRQIQVAGLLHSDREVLDGGCHGIQLLADEQDAGVPPELRGDRSAGGCGFWLA